jgi:hypothetical protein
MSREELRANPVVKGWLKSVTNGDAEKEAVLLGALQDAIDAGETLKTVDLVSLATEALGVDEPTATGGEEAEEMIEDDADIVENGVEIATAGVLTDEGRRRANWSWGPVTGPSKAADCIAAVDIHCDEPWKALQCLKVEAQLSRPRKGLVKALVARVKELEGTLPEGLGKQVEEILKKKPRGVATVTAIKPTKLTDAEQALANEAAEALIEHPATTEVEDDDAPAAAAPPPKPKPKPTSRWSAPEHAVRIAPSKLVNAWLLPRPDGNAAALVRIRKFDGNKVGVFKVKDTGFKMPAKGADVTEAQVKKLVAKAEAGTQVALEGNKAATDKLKAAITEAGVEFPAPAAA